MAECTRSQALALCALSITAPDGQVRCLRPATDHQGLVNGMAANAVTRLLGRDDIVLDLDARTKDSLFHAVAQLFGRRHGMTPGRVIDSLSARERLGSTGLGQGVAIPHARIKGLDEAVAAYLRLRSPVPFDAPDGKPVVHVFALLVPEQATDEHLRILAEMAQMLSDAEFRERLGTAADADAVHGLFAAWCP